MLPEMLKTRRLPLRMRLARLALLITVVPLGCNETGPEAFSVHGTWTGSVTQLELELEMVLILDGENVILGFAEMSSLPTGTVQGEVSGSLQGADVSLTIAIDGVIVAGSIVFEGSFQDEETMTGTLSSGLLAGVFDITLRKKQV